VNVDSGDALFELNTAGTAETNNGIKRDLVFTA